VVVSVSQQESRAKTGTETFKGPVEDLPQLQLRVPLFGVLTPVFNFPRYKISVEVHHLIKRDLSVGAPFAQSHQGFVHGDPHKPGIKTRGPVELAELAIGFQQRLLHCILGVFVVPRDPDRKTINITVILTYKSKKGFVTA